MAPDSEKVKSLEENIFTPALVQAFKVAKDEGNSKEDAVYAAANAYMNLINNLISDSKQVEALFQNQLQFLQENLRDK